MKCSKGHVNPDGAKFCCACGEKLPEMKSCPNKGCVNFGKYNLPADADFCPDCGTSVKTTPPVPELEIPFPNLHPEYNLVPLCDFRYRTHIGFFFARTPHFIEQKERVEGINYYFIAKDRKLGVMRYEWHKHWYGDTNKNTTIISMEFDKIENADPYFICYKGNNKYFYDREGKRMK